MHFVSSVLKTIDNEIQKVLETLTNLKEHETWTNDNFYYRKNVLFTLHNYSLSLLPPYEDRSKHSNLDDGDGRVIAKGNSEDVQRLKREIERIRDNHKEDFDKIENGFERDKKILSEIKSVVKDIIYELSLPDRIQKGRCDYCKSLK